MSTEGQDFENDDMLPEYDFTGGIRGKHHAAHREDMDSSTPAKLDPRVERLLKLIVEARRAKQAAVSDGKKLSPSCAACPLSCFPPEMLRPTLWGFRSE